MKSRMDWKIPDFLQQTFGASRPDNNAAAASRSSAIADDDEEEDVSVRDTQHKGNVPFRRVESAVHTFVHVAVPADLDRLYRHRSNIKKWKKRNEFEKLRAEYLNSARTVKQLNLNLKEMESLRAKVLREDLAKFDEEMKSAKEQALSAIFEFLEIHGEGLGGEAITTGSGLETGTGKQEDQGDIGTQSESDTQSRNTIEAYPENNPKGCGTAASEGNSHHHHSSLTQEEKDAVPVVQMRGNQLVIEPASSLGATSINHPLSELRVDERSQTEDEHQQLLQTQSHVEKSKSEKESDEVWEKLRKDLLDLHDMISDFSTLVHSQGEVVDDIESNIEQAEANIQEGNKYLKKSTVLKAAMFPVLGAVFGGVVGGPIGLVAGFKLGSVTSGLAAASVTGSLIGYQGGKILKKQTEPESMEMQERTNEQKENSEKAEEEKINKQDFPLQ